MVGNENNPDTAFSTRLQSLSVLRRYAITISEWMKFILDSFQASPKTIASSSPLSIVGGGVDDDNDNSASSTIMNKAIRGLKRHSSLTESEQVRQISSSHAQITQTYAHTHYTSQSSLMREDDNGDTDVDDLFRSMLQHSTSAEMRKVKRLKMDLAQRELSQKGRKRKKGRGEDEKEREGNFDHIFIDFST
jgi:hypothetical protein